jgi:hypothetical protein
MKKQLREMINEIREINLDSYTFTERFHNNINDYSFKMNDYDCEVKVIIFNDPKKEHFIDVDVYINTNKVKGLIIHNEHQIKSLKDFITFLVWQ